MLHFHFTDEETEGGSGELPSVTQLVSEIPDLSPWPSDSWDASLLCSRLLLQVSNWPLAPTPSQRVLMPLSVTHIPEGPTASASALHLPSLKETKVRAPP